MFPFDDAIMRDFSNESCYGYTFYYQKLLEVVDASSQWETALLRNAISHWLGAYTELSLMMTEFTNGPFGIWT